MKIVTTLVERDAIPNPLRYQHNSDNSWTGYEQGDTLPVLPAPPVVYEDVRLGSQNRVATCSQF